MFRILVLLCTILVFVSSVPIPANLDANLANFFARMDINLDGKGTFQEFSRVVHVMDADKNGKVIFKEFLARTSEEPAFAALLFRQFDFDADGHLDDDDIQYWFKKFDSNLDGALTSAEFDKEYKTMVLSIQPVTTPATTVSS